MTFGNAAIRHGLSLIVFLKWIDYSSIAIQKNFCEVQHKKHTSSLIWRRFAAENILFPAENVLFPSENVLFPSENVLLVHQSCSEVPCDIGVHHRLEVLELAALQRAEDGNLIKIYMG